MRTKKRPYQFKPTTLTLKKLTALMETQQGVIDLSGFSNGKTWLKSLNASLKESRSMAASAPTPIW